MQLDHFEFSLTRCVGKTYDPGKTFQLLEDFLMATSSLTLTLTPKGRSDRFTLTGSMGSYNIAFSSDTVAWLRDLLHQLHSVLTARGDTNNFSSSEIIRTIGIKLWQILLPDSAPIEMRKALEQELRRDASPLLLVLPDDLAIWPWELLYDSQQPDNRGFLVLRRPFVRLIQDSTELPSLAQPLRILLLISSPPKMDEWQRIDVESERAAVESATREYRERGLLNLLVVDIVTPSRVQQAVLRFKPHLLHYIGHGGYDEDSGGFLVWEDEQGKPQLIHAVLLADLLRPRGLRAVLLQGCKVASHDSLSDFHSVAKALMDVGIPAVLVQQVDFTYELQQRACETFYTALASGMGLAEATFEVRRTLTLASANHPNWAIPMLQATVGGLMPLLKGNTLSASPNPALVQSRATHDLPDSTSVFVGRQRELRALCTMLESVSRTGPTLALITGPGGVGKSTLVALAIARYGGHYKTTLILSCINYQGIDLFLQRIGEFLKQHQLPSFLESILPDPKISMTTKIHEAIEELNSAGPLLLVLDNLEGAQQNDLTLTDSNLLLFLQKLMISLHNGRLLMIGRYNVLGLFSKRQTKVLRLTLGDLNDYETLALLERHPTLAHLDSTVRNKLVHEFGGLPNVYDLLANQVGSQMLETISHDVQGRASLERGQEVVEITALKATVTQLTGNARILLARLSIFRRPFPLEALEQALRATYAEGQSLIDRGLLYYDPLNGGYRLHRLTARYAEELLDVSNRITTQIQIAEWYLQYADISRDIADYLEAYHLFKSAGEVQRANKLANSIGETLGQFGLYQIWRDLCMATVHDNQGSLAAEAQRQLGEIAQAQGDYLEARGLYSKALNNFERLGDQAGRGTVQQNLGNIAQAQGDYPEARRLYSEALSIFEQLGDQTGRATVQQNLGNIAQAQGDYPEARRLYSEVLSIFEQLGDQTGRATVQQNLGNIAQAQGDYPEARRLYSEALSIFEQLGDQTGRATVQQNLGNIAQAQGDYPEARRLYSEALSIFERLGDQTGRASTLHQLGNIAQAQGDYLEAQRLYGESLAIKERSGNQGGRASTLHQLGIIAQAQGDYPEARRLYSEALSIFERLGDQTGRASTLHQLGIIAQAQGDYPEARRLYSENLAMEERLGDQTGRASTLHQLGNIAQAQGDYPEARRLYSEALSIFERLGDQTGRATVQQNLGNIAQAQGDYPEARRLYSEALSIFERLGDQTGRASTLHQLGNIAQAQGNYLEAQRLYSEALNIFERLGDQTGRASTLHQLGIIAQAQGDYPEARRLYDESLALTERLGDQSGRAFTLGQLGLLEREHGDYAGALSYTVQALLIFERLRSPYRSLALRTIAELRSKLGEARFSELWQEVTGGQPLPDLPSINPQQQLLQQLISFIQARTWDESRRVVEADSELLGSEADELLKQLAAAQQDADARDLIEQHRMLLARCREVGIAAAFAESQVS
jgi:tetratricopeptide (TPR) repeat protein